jgi:hypothetical protein
LEFSTAELPSRLELMQIHSPNPVFPFQLRQTAPPGVSVVFDSPRMTRDFNSVMPAVLVTLHFAATVDVGEVTRWLFEKLSAEKGAETTYERSKIQISLGSLKAVIEKEKYTQTKPGR